MIKELGELIESCPSGSPFCQSAAMLIKVASSDVEREKARDDRIRVLGGTRCEPVRGEELLIFVKPVENE